MSTPRNFRKLLDVDPDARPFNCVGVTAGGERCGQFMFDRGDLSRASSLLTKMESQTLKGSYRYLEELAFLTLCPRWHRNPGYSQVALVTLRWTQKIQQREKEEAEMAMTFAMKQAIARKAVAAEEVKVTIKEERTGKIPATAQISQGYRLSANVKTTDLVDPFVTRNSSVHATVLESPFTRRLKESRTTTSETSSHNESLQRLISNKTKADIRSDSPTIPDRISNLPSPPDTPLALRQTASQDTEEEHEKLPVLVTGSKANTTEPEETTQRFKFDYQPGRSTAIRAPLGSSLKPVDLHFQPATAPSYWPETPKTTPTSRIQRREVSHFGLKQRVALLASGAGSPSTPFVAIPVLEKSSTMCNNIDNDSESESKQEITEHVRNMGGDVPVAQSSDLVEENSNDINSTLAPVALGDGVAATLPREELPQTPGQTPDEENFGYAVITSSTRSRTYLPATHRYGLMTPPDEPDSMGIANVKPHATVVDNDQAATPSPAVHQRQSFMIPRKPVNSIACSSPSKSPAQNSATGYEGHKEVAKEVSDHVWPANHSDSYCPPLSDSEGVHAGCLGGLRMIRLREAVVGRVKYMRERGRWANVKSPILQVRR